MATKSWLDNPRGLFSLSDSDKYVGSFISKEDVKEIMDVSDIDLKKVKFEIINGVEVIDEVKLRKIWQDGDISHAPCHYCGNTKVSLDELILAAIIKRTYPSAKVERQIKMGNNRIDIWAELNGEGFFIEFDGPGHFKKWKNDKLQESPLVRKQKVEEFFAKDDFKCYIWPYWVQRCSLNLRILVEKGILECGRGALWSSKSFFHDFDIENATEIIRDLTAQFRAAPDGNYGYFYEGSDTEMLHKPEHFIIKKILSGKQDYHLLIPPGTSPSEEDNWLPQSIIDYKNRNNK